MAENSIKCSGYSYFAGCYDALTENVNYTKRAEYLCQIIDKYGKSPKLVLDLACGTGELTVKMAKKGYDMIGVDCSADMLDVAINKAKEEKQDILFLKQKMQTLDLFGTIDMAVCSLDSINHLTTIRDVSKAISKVSLFMNKGGLFVFDANTPYKHKKILANNAFVYETQDVFCAWQNSYNNKTRLVTINLDFFEKQPQSGTTYERYSEQFCERAYSQDMLCKLLAENGFKVLGVFNEQSFDEPKDDSERLVYVCEKLYTQNMKDE